MLVKTVLAAIGLLLLILSLVAIVLYFIDDRKYHREASNEGAYCYNSD